MTEDDRTKSGEGEDSVPARTSAQSDSPPPDLRKQRDEFLQNFSRSARLTEQFIRDYEGLAERVHKLETENASLRAKVEADDAIRELLRKIEELEREKTDLLSRYREAERTSNGLSERFAQFEEEFSNLANLFVASNQLHSSLSPRRVTRRIKEVLAQLVGAERYAVFLMNSEGTELVPIASEGVSGDELAPIGVDREPISGVIRTGSAYVDEVGDPSQGSIQEPPAVIPLRIDDDTVGAIIIYATLSQKTSFANIDFELFKLLGQHAAAALVSASLHAQQGPKRPGLEAFVDLSV
ncbi:MAG: GAF domain-containing protein [Polyangiaceae bacterium]|nr:GAF domain-containing protein [Myxococcales bacterium]MCB9588846.1 GAF domain-containing protein [Polyangiaceae bacterium]MCB9605405.1 GAF domain-containing protein [Polyangiaceae bacterium]